VIEALTRLPDYLGGFTNVAKGTWISAATVAGLQSGMAKTICQAVGVTYQGRQCILLSCLPSVDSLSSGWKERYVRAEDRGPGFWRVIYVPDEQRFTRLQLHGDY
jgi:hypothetical protein